MPLFVSTILFALILLVFIQLPHASAENSAELISILDSAENSITLVFNAPAWTVDTVTRDGEQLSSINMPGSAPLEQTGAPQLPLAGVLVGVPTHDDVTLEILSQRSQSVALTYPLITTEAIAVPDLSGAVEDETWTVSDWNSAELPDTAAEIGNMGMLRDQPFVQVQFYPVQQTTQTLTVHDEIVVKVSWGAAREGDFRPNHPAYENLVATSLINYDQLQRPAPITNASMPAIVRTTDAITTVLKITINQDGLYAMTHADLLAAGWNPDTINPTNLQLQHRDVNVAIIVESEQDGTFSEGDRILFYAEGYEDLYVNQNVYWLHEGASPGMRLGTLDGVPSSADHLPHFATTEHFEVDTDYWRSMPDGAGQDHWFWLGRISPNASGLDITRTLPFTLANIATEPFDATLRVQLKGYTGLDHNSQIRLNGVTLGDLLWSGQISITQVVTFPQSLLIDGENTLEVVALDTGAVVDQYYVNWFEIDYFDRFVMEEDELRFGLNSAETVTITNLTTSTHYLLDISSPYSPTQLTNTLVTSQTDNYQVAFSSQTALSDAAMFSENAIRFPELVALDTPSNWKSSTNGADYIVITHGDFITDANRLATHRQGDGYRTAVVDVQDIYDEFNGGLFAPEPIRDFLDYARLNWQEPAPSYVVLLGDGYMDYKDYLNSGTRNFVPPYLYESDIFGQVPSDNWFVTLAGDDVLPEMYIGRLSAETPQQSAAIVDKIIGYDSQAISSTPTALFVADDDSTSFETASEQVIDNFSTEWTIERIYAAGYPPDSPTNAITSTINSGVQFINYSGHGEYYRWGKWDSESSFIFGTANVPALSNATLPIVTIGNCLNGFFTSYSNRFSLAEALQRETDGGAVAVWAATSLGYTSGHKLMMDAYYSRQLTNPSDSIGVATTFAAVETIASSLYWSEMIATFVIMGDPATQPAIDQTVPTSIRLKHYAQSNLHLPMVPLLLFIFLSAATIGWRRRLMLFAMRKFLPMFFHG